MFLSWLWLSAATFGGVVTMAFGRRSVNDLNLNLLWGGWLAKFQDCWKLQPRFSLPKLHVDRNLNSPTCSSRHKT